MSYGRALSLRPPFIPMSDSLLPYSIEHTDMPVPFGSIHSVHNIDDKPPDDYSSRFSKRRESNEQKQSRLSCDWSTIKRLLVKRKWYGGSILLIIALAVGPAIGIGLETLGVGGTHEPLHVVSVDGNPPREGVSTSNKTCPMCTYVCLCSYFSTGA